MKPGISPVEFSNIEAMHKIKGTPKTFPGRDNLQRIAPSVELCPSRTPDVFYEEVKWAEAHVAVETMRHAALAVGSGLNDPVVAQYTFHGADEVHDKRRGGSRSHRSSELPGERDSIVQGHHINAHSAAGLGLN